MTSSAKSLAIQYAQAKRQAQNPMAEQTSTKSSFIDAENNNNNNDQLIEIETDARAELDNVSLQLPSAAQSLELQTSDLTNCNTNSNTNNQRQQGTFSKSNNNKTISNNNKKKSVNGAAKQRPKSTSMTNLVMVPSNEQQRAHSQSRSPSRNNNNNNTMQQQQQQQQHRMQRPASRSALDNIHKGMNAKYAAVQSKVLLQNIRPQNGVSSPQQRRAGSTLGRSTTPAKSSMTNSTSTGNLANNNVERAQLIAKLKSLQEQLELTEATCDNLKQENERDKKLRNEQIGQLKQELQDKLAEHERQNEDQHQKLMEAYELADQNRRTADTVLSESRQRDEESKKRIQELESQLNELKEFVAMKEEMNGKLFELREQLREERERYEEQLKSLHSVFDNEKIR